MDLTIGIVATNEVKCLRLCLKALYSGLPRNKSREVIVIDNCSNDGTSEFVRENYSDIKLIMNRQKLDISKNRNLIINQSRGEYLLFLDANVFIAGDYINELFNVIVKSEKTGMAIGKLLKADVYGNPVKGPCGKNIIDSTGHTIYKDRKVVDRGTLEEDVGQYDKEREMFGVGSAATLFKRKLLEDIKLFGEYFDESFNTYKEEIDLCWRARLRGWPCVYEPSAVAYHARTWPKEKERKFIPKELRQHSFKNRYLMMIKNDHFINYLRSSPYIFWYELKAFTYVLFREPCLLSAMVKVFALLPLTIKKRAEIMRRSVISPNDIQKWFI